jgi:type 1 glutamine amidotransferase
MKFISGKIAVLAFALMALTVSLQAHEHKLRILLMNGGCCHDYHVQGPVLKEAIEAALNAEVVIENASSKKTNATFKSYEKEDWAAHYDLIIHNECTANVTDKAYVKRILDAHINGVPAINLHCAMHSYRWGKFKEPVKVGDDNAGWFEFNGVQSSGHGPKGPINVQYSDAKHPITVGLKNWTTPAGELYNNVQLFKGTTVLAMGVQDTAIKKGKESKVNIKDAAIIWTSTYGPKKTKVFSISIGHSSAEMKTPEFKELLIRGVLWTTDNINEDGSAKNDLAK